jgi:hypothetical protein
LTLHAHAEHPPVASDRPDPGQLLNLADPEAPLIVDEGRPAGELPGGVVGGRALARQASEGPDGRGPRRGGRSSPGRPAPKRPTRNRTAETTTTSAPTIRTGTLPEANPRTTRATPRTTTTSAGSLSMRSVWTPRSPPRERPSRQLREADHRDGGRFPQGELRTGVDIVGKSGRPRPASHDEDRPPEEQGQPDDHVGHADERVGPARPQDEPAEREGDACGS